MFLSVNHCNFSIRFPLPVHLYYCFHYTSLPPEKIAYVYVDGIYLRRNWGGEFENVAILVAIAVNEDGYREVLGAAEGMKEDKAQLD